MSGEVRSTWVSFTITLSAQPMLYHNQHSLVQPYCNFLPSPYFFAQTKFVQRILVRPPLNHHGCSNFILFFFWTIFELCQVLTCFKTWLFINPRLSLQTTQILFFTSFWKIHSSKTRDSRGFFALKMTSCFLDCLKNAYFLSFLYLII